MPTKTAQRRGFSPPTVAAPPRHSLIWNRDRTALTIEMWITKTSHDGRYPDTVTIHSTGNPATCPITAVERLVDLRRRYGITDPALALFTGIHRTGRPATSALSGQSVTDILQSRVRDAIGGDVSG